MANTFEDIRQRIREESVEHIQNMDFTSVLNASNPEGNPTYCVLKDIGFSDNKIVELEEYSRTVAEEAHSDETSFVFFIGAIVGAKFIHELNKDTSE